MLNFVREQRETGPDRRFKIERSELKFRWKEGKIVDNNFICD